MTEDTDNLWADAWDTVQALKAGSFKVANGQVTAEEKKYTLEEAKLELARRDCAVIGHDFEHVVDLGLNPVRVVCTRCHAYWRVRKHES